ncbi:hypothetical protein AVEN_124078-1 [Araneus ventricosus]|uniref:Uncharacterized protein n=1 Tax=Araneus ventricosus TaxID=182803 RepID=A0A4Y2RTU6_ARAVE|nr:hypothetical protein AVEN_124078-1 [Araneus ventricosus]
MSRIPYHSDFISISEISLIRTFIISFEITLDPAMTNFEIEKKKIHLRCSKSLVKPAGVVSPKLSSIRPNTSGENYTERQSDGRFPNTGGEKRVQIFLRRRMVKKSNMQFERLFFNRLKPKLDTDLQLR